MTSIDVPDTPVFNESMPITVTIHNASTVDLSGVYFDTDIYIDPDHEPDPLYPYPPGDFKLWVDYLAAGRQHQPGTGCCPKRLAGPHRIRPAPTRPDTSVRWTAPIRRTTCSQSWWPRKGAAPRWTKPSPTIRPVDSTFSSGWTEVELGNGAGSASIANDLISITSRGTGHYLPANDSSAGYYLYYQTVSGDFDVRVRAVSRSTFNGIKNTAKLGVEVRDSSATNAKKVYLMHQYSSNLQYGYRSTDGGTVTTDQVSGSPSAFPVWLRIKRIGNVFSLYYSTSTTVAAG